MSRTSVLCAAVGLVVSAGLLAGCASGGDSATPTPGTQASGGTTSTTAARVDCNLEVLAPVVDAKVKGAGLDDLVCDSPFAVATVRAADPATGDAVVLLRLTAGQWAAVASGPALGDTAALLPADFSTTAFRSWKARYDAKMTPVTPTSARPRGIPTTSTTAVPE